MKMFSLDRFALLAGIVMMVQGHASQAGLTLVPRDGCDAECAVYKQAAISCQTADCFCHENIAQGLQSCMDCSITSDNVVTTQRIIDSYNLSCRGVTDVQSVTLPAAPATTTDAGGASKTASIISSIASQVVSAVTSALDATSTTTATNTSTSVSTSGSASVSLNQTATSNASGTAAPTQSGAKSGGVIDFGGRDVLLGWLIAMSLGMALAV